MSTTLQRKDGPGTTRIGVAEAVRRKNYMLKHSPNREHASQIADRLVVCVEKLRRWMHDNGCRVARLAQIVGCGEGTAKRWTVAANRPLPVWRVKIERATGGAVKAVEWSTEREINEARRYIAHYEEQKAKLVNNGSFKRRREAYRDADRIRLYGSYAICGEEIPYEIRSFIERSPLGNWKQTGPA